MKFSGFSFSKDKCSVFFVHLDRCVMLSFSSDTPYMYYDAVELESMASDALKVTCQHDFNVLKSHWSYLSDIWLGTSEVALCVHYS